MKLRNFAALALASASPALAGPPYLTDDPEPTDLGHWEIYAFTAGEGRGPDVGDESGFDLNYGGAKDVQLTATLPLALDRDVQDGWRGGTGDVELGVKYRFLHKNGISAAIFPRAILPTSSLSRGEKTQFLLPIWIGKDFRGGTSLFGGGGYQFNPGAGNRSFWEAALALTQQVNQKLSVGAEVTRQGPDSVGATAKTQAGAGAILQLSGHYALLASGGPTWAEHHSGYHFYGALGLFF